MATISPIGAEPGPHQLAVEDVVRAPAALRLGLGRRRQHHHEAEHHEQRDDDGEDVVPDGRRAALHVPERNPLAPEQVDEWSPPRLLGDLQPFESQPPTVVHGQQRSLGITLRGVVRDIRRVALWSSTGAGHPAGDAARTVLDHAAERRDTPVVAAAPRPVEPILEPRLVHRHGLAPCVILERTSSRKWSPRSSYPPPGYQSKLAQPGDSRTTSPGRAAAPATSTASGIEDAAEDRWCRRTRRRPRRPLRRSRRRRAPCSGGPPSATGRDPCCGRRR